MTGYSLARKPSSQSSTTPKPETISPVSNKAAPTIHHATASGGTALDTKTQREMGSRFGHDFSQVRVHTDSRAVESAQTLGANAYAVGSDIVFGPGRYAPGSADGDRLIAHELTHVVQQARYGAGRAGALSSRGDASEQEAEAAAERIVAGQTANVQAVPSAALAREEDHSLRDYLINMGSFAGGMIPGPVGSAIGLASSVLGGEESVRTLPGQSDQDRGMKNVEGGLGFLNGIMGTAAGLAGFDGAAAVGLGEGAALGGSGAAGGAAALGPVSLVLGAGLAGAATGHMLAEHTEVGQDSADTVGGIDHLLTGSGERSAMLRLDEYRQDQWDKGGVGGVATSLGAGVGEGVVGLGGAIGGLLEGGYHGLGALSGMI